jgi:hypothetical protein
LEDAPSLKKMTDPEERTTESKEKLAELTDTRGDSDILGTSRVKKKKEIVSLMTPTDPTQVPVEHVSFACPLACQMFTIRVPRLWSVACS